MFYLDTSVVVAALAEEAKTEAVQRWLAAQAPGDLLISEWTRTEFSSAMSIKLRTGQVDARQRADALATFNQLAADSFTLIPVSSAQFRTAARFADQHTLGIRGGDALHLAIAGDRGATICTLDHRLITAGEALGVATLIPA